jgi:predicted aconitase with swiveling domain
MLDEVLAEAEREGYYPLDVVLKEMDEIIAKASLSSE